MKHGQQVARVGVSPLSRQNMVEEARVIRAGFLFFLTRDALKPCLAVKELFRFRVRYQPQALARALAALRVGVTVAEICAQKRKSP